VRASFTARRSLSWLRAVQERVDLVKQQADRIEGLNVEEVEAFVSNYIQHGSNDILANAMAHMNPLDRFALKIYSLSGASRGQPLTVGDVPHRRNQEQTDDDDAFQGWCEISAFNGLDVQVRIMFPSNTMDDGAIMRIKVTNLCGPGYTAG